MFRRPSPEKMRSKDLGDRFARTFLLTFCVTYLCYPIVLFGVSEPDSGTGSGWLVFTAWLFGLPFALKALFIGMIASAVVFFPVYHGLGKLMTNRSAAPIAASLAMFGAVICSVHTRFSISPVGMYWDVGPHGCAFSKSLGVFAAIVGAGIARMMWIGADPHV